MKTKHIAAIIFGVTALIVIGYTIYKVVTGKEIGLNEIVVSGTVIMMFLSALTWGNDRDDDGIRQDEELGQIIKEKSSKIGYFVLTLFIFLAVAAEKIMYDTTNMFLLLLLGLSMVTLPLIEFFVAKKYQ